MLIKLISFSVLTIFIKEPYQLGRCDGDILNFSPTHQQIVPDCIWLPAVNLQRVMRSGEDTMSFIMESDSSAKKRGKIENE